MNDNKKQELLDATKQLVRNRLSEILPTNKKVVVTQMVSEAKKLITEALYVMSKPFVLKTDALSQFTKENHFKLYQNYIDSYNKINPRIDGIDKNIDPMNPNNSEFRRLKANEMHNSNGFKLHELYFSNISDLTSAVRADSVPFIRLSKDFGTFEQWQYDFRACGMAATEGWAICYYDPRFKKYVNCFVEKHVENVPVMGIPIIVVDTWHHAWFKDYGADKIGYLNAMMLELNWAVIEQRMMIAERANLDQIYNVVPVQSSGFESIVGKAVNVAPIKTSAPETLPPQLTRQPTMIPPEPLETLPPVTTLERPIPSLKEGSKKNGQSK